MPKSIHFTGQPVLSQLTKLLPKSKILAIAREQNADRYVKAFTTWNHLVTMLFSTFSRCSGLRELESGLYGFSARLGSTGLTHIAPKSTLADANKRRSSDVFEAIFKAVYLHLHHLLPDSRNQNEHWLQKLLLIDSTTITLFKEIMKAAGRTPANGKRKGGVKVHIGMKLDENIPCLVRITSSATHDTTFLKHLGSLQKGTILVFDKAYADFKLFNQWTEDGIIWVSRLKNWFVVTPVEGLEVSDENKQKGVLKDQVIELGHSTQKMKVTCRLITFYDQEKDRTFEFICNDLDQDPFVIAQIYKQRWQIELLFKRLKQNLQLSNFLGDNENAIKIQIWCNLLADLLIAVIKKRVKRTMAYSVVAGFIRIHLMNYVDVIKLLKKPNDKNLFWDPVDKLQTEMRFHDPPLVL
jgi:hypothetical protein